MTMRPYRVSVPTRVIGPYAGISSYVASAARRTARAVNAHLRPDVGMLLTGHLGICRWGFAMHPTRLPSFA